MIIHGFDKDIDRAVQEAVRDQLEHEEKRVRDAAADLLGEWAKLKGILVWERFGTDLLAIIEENEERKPVNEEDIAKQRKQTHLRHDTEGWNALESALRSVLRIIEGVHQHTTMQGNMQAQRMATRKSTEQSSQSTSNDQPTTSSPQASPAPSLAPFPLSVRFIETLYRLIRHQNRFVRETGFGVVGALFAGGLTGLSAPFVSSTGPTLQDICVRVASLLSDGLQDDFSHVTYAASQAARQFVLYLRKQAELKWKAQHASIPFAMMGVLEAFGGVASNKTVEASQTATDGTLDVTSIAEYALLNHCMVLLLPAMCLNRYVSQEGLRGVSLQSWKMLVHTEGPALVSLYFPRILQFYHLMSQHTNAIIRETAAFCLGELMKKIEKARGAWPASSGLPLAATTQALVVRECLMRLAADPSWPVRDAACASLQHFVTFVGEQNLEAHDPPLETPPQGLLALPSSMDSSTTLNTSPDPYALEEVVHLLEERMRDPLAVIREDAASALVALALRPASMIPTSLYIRPRKTAHGGDDDGDDSSSDESSDDDSPPGLPNTPSEDHHDHHKHDKDDHSHDDADMREEASYEERILRLIERNLPAVLLRPLPLSSPPSHDSNSTAHTSNPLAPTTTPLATHSTSSIHPSSSSALPLTSDPSFPSSSYLAASGESSFGPLSKHLHDNDPALHSQQEIFSCECHANPHGCRFHPLTSQAAQPWEISQGALFLLRELIAKYYPPTSTTEASKSPRHSLTLKRQTRLSTLVSMAISMVTKTKNNFSKYTTWMTSLLEVLRAIMAMAPGLATLRGEEEGHGWAQLIPSLFDSIQAQEKTSVTTVVRVPGRPQENGQGMMDRKEEETSRTRTATRRSAPSTQQSHFQASSSSVLPSNTLPFVPMHSTPFDPLKSTPHYAASISPSLAKASSSLLLVEASSLLLADLLALLGRPRFASLALLPPDAFSSSSRAPPSAPDATISPQNLAIFRRHILPLLAGSSRP